MTTIAQKTLFRNYARGVRNARRAHPGISEPGLAPQFQRLLEAILPTLPAAPLLTLVPEFQNPSVGRPDIALKRAGEPARGFVEMKSSDKSTDGSSWRDAHDKRQFQRFGELAHWAVCNFYEVRLYERREDIGYASFVPLGALDPARSDVAADRLVDAHDPDAALRLLERLAQASQPSAKDAPELAASLAHSARLVNGIVRDRLAEMREEGMENTALQQVRQDFRDVLYSHPEAAGYPAHDFDVLFAGAFAQTLAFGLLLVREATGAPVDRHAAEHMPTEHPFMRTALEVLSMEPVVRELGAGFDVMLDTVNGFSPEILAVGTDGRDPILYFYEDFLETFDPEARGRYGVYYTPIDVVRYIVSAVDRALQDCLGTDGLVDEQVHVLDPAVGTGTFLLGVADRLRHDVMDETGPGQVPAALRGLAARMYGFELLVGPYAVAHYRLHHALSRNADGQLIVPDLPRLGIYLTDTLARPGAAAPAGVLGFVSDGIRDERLESNRIKTEQPILAILGNPPYRRLETGENETLVGRWMDELWDDLKAPVRAAGQGGQLNTFPELSVAFWRWSMWKLFEAANAPGRGVVTFITNRKFLTGWPYAGLRGMMRERFDHIKIVDLRGDVRRGERAGVGVDQGVFNIQVGTAIIVAIADGSKVPGAPATVTYNDSWAHGFVSRQAKLAWLRIGAGTGSLDGAVEINRGALDDMRPPPFSNGEWVSVRECFVEASSGIQTKRDAFVYAIERHSLVSRIRAFVGNLAWSDLPGFAGTVANPEAIARLQPFDERRIREIAYRPLDRRFLYNHEKYVDRSRPTLQRMWGGDNVALYMLPSGAGTGPAVWCQGLLPDYHAFRGSYGGYAFPLHDRRPGHGPSNVNVLLVEALGAAYGMIVSPEMIFNAILALLSAESYTTWFAEDLEDIFPHVPLPSDPTVFQAAIAVGADIRAIETFERRPHASYVRGRARALTPPNGLLGPVDWTDGSITLCANGSGRIENVPHVVWEFAVSGYRIVPRWLAAREGSEIGPTFIPELRDLIGRVAELKDLFATADGILQRTLNSRLSRAVLGLDD